MKYIYLLITVLLTSSCASTGYRPSYIMTKEGTPSDEAPGEDKNSSHIQKSITD